MKAALKAPSAKIARKWLGSRQATKNASATGPAPRMAASMISRTKPVSRDSKVSPPTVKMRPIIDLRPWSRVAARAPGLKSSGKRLPNRGDDPILGRLVEIGMHRQADHVFGQSFGDRHAALDHRIVPIGLLAIERD